MSTTRTLRVSIHPTAEQQKVLRDLMRQYAELCEALAVIARSGAEIKTAPDLSRIAGERLRGKVHIPWRYVNLGSIRVMRSLRADPDFVFQRGGGDFLPVDMDEKVISFKGDGKITIAPQLHVSISAGADKRLLIPCEYEVVGNSGGAKAGGAQLFFMSWCDMWEVRVTAEVDDVTAYKADITANDYGE